MGDFLAVMSGCFVGFTLGLIGGGGSVIATPLLLYLVGLEPHMAIGTGALAVSANAFVNFAGHARAGNVRWPVAFIFAITGAIGAMIGSTLGKAVDGQRLILLFGMMMVVIGLLMLRPRGKGGDGHLVMSKAAIAKVVGTGLLVGLMAGFFGIGGGFLIVPGLILSTGMPMIYAVGTSLLAVGTFGLTTAINYSLSGMVNWPIAGEFIIGGVAGGFLGMKAAIRLSGQRNTLHRMFAALVLGVAAYIIYRSLNQHS